MRVYLSDAAKLRKAHVAAYNEGCKAGLSVNTDRSANNYARAVRNGCGDPEIIEMASQWEAGFIAQGGDRKYGAA